MILIGYRHGLRASELCDLRWSQVELATGRLHVRRTKNGSPSVHPMQGDEIRALRRLQREQELSSHVFMTERDGPMTPKAFHALFGRIGARAKMQFPIHPQTSPNTCPTRRRSIPTRSQLRRMFSPNRRIRHHHPFFKLISRMHLQIVEVNSNLPGGMWQTHHTPEQC
jgi:type 1 fimbriae regulatory protein FimB/type 1 fimbriae regulatory protein FimE